MLWTNACLVVLLSLPFPIPPQNTSNQQKDPSYDLWLVRSQTITDELVKDGANLEPLQTAILKEAIAALNRSEEADEKGGANEEARYWEKSGIWKNLPVSLIEMDEYAVKEAVSSINSRQARIAVRLELLQACLERMRSTKNGDSTSKRRLVN